MDALGLRCHAPADLYVGKMLHPLSSRPSAFRAGHGHEYVALGSDFDGWVAVTEGPLRQGFSETTIRGVMGENFARLLLRALA